MSLKFATEDRMTLEQLRAADVPRAKATDLLTITPNPDGDPDEASALIAALDAYMSDFCKPTENRTCISCGRSLGGLAGVLVGGFRWGLAWGEGACGCGYPGRGMHQPKDANGEKIFDGPLQFILQYHPSGLSRNPERTDDE